MYQSLEKLRKIIETELEYARTRWGRSLHVTELELALQIVCKLIGECTHVKESV